MQRRKWLVAELCVWALGVPVPGAGMPLGPRSWPWHMQKFGLKCAFASVLTETATQFHYGVSWQPSGLIAAAHTYNL